MQGSQVTAPELPIVRRFEAAGFRAWPAAAVHYDGAWVIRLTAGHPAKRLNSINPIDPGDCGDLEGRIARASRRFEAYGRPPTFRLSPLAGAAISKHLDGERWSGFSESLVMRLSLDDVHFDDVISQIPMKDLARFIAASIAVHDLEESARAGLTEIITSIEPETGFFVLEHDERPVASAICVHDGDLAGLFEVASAAAERGNGYGRRVVLSALKWARLRGARLAWLQVEADNAAAIGLYRSLGFREIYRYHYRRPSSP